MCLDGDGTMYCLGIRSRRRREQDWKTIPCVVALIQFCSPSLCQNHYMRQENKSRADTQIPEFEETEIARVL